MITSDKRRMGSIAREPPPASARSQLDDGVISSAPGTAVANSFKTFECLLVLLCSPVQALKCSRAYSAESIRGGALPPHPRGPRLAIAGVAAKGPIV